MADLDRIRAWIDDPEPVLVIAGNFDRFRHWCELRGVKPSSVTYAANPRQTCRGCNSFKVVAVTGNAYRRDIWDAIRGRRYETIYDVM